jgi:hypothetical protein
MKGRFSKVPAGRDAEVRAKERIKSMRGIGKSKKR